MSDASSSSAAPTSAEVGEGASVRIAWRRLNGGGLVVSALIFALMLVTLALRDGEFQAIHRMLMMVVAAGMLYFVVARRINVTQLTVKAAALHVTHGPLPLRSGVVAPLEMVAGVRCDRHGRRLLLHTKQGEEVILLEDVPPKLLDELRPAIVSRLGLPLV